MLMAVSIQESQIGRRLPPSKTSIFSSGNPPYTAIPESHLRSVIFLSSIGKHKELMA